MARLSIFTTPKPFTDPHIAMIQANSVKSWKALGVDVDIWLVGEETGVEAVAKELGVNFIAEVERTSGGTPRIDSIFSAIRVRSEAPYLCYVNADILLFPDMLASLDLVQQRYARFLLVGQRWDLNITRPLELNIDWPDKFLQQVHASGELHPATGSDYFVFPREFFSDVLPFAVGRIGWDNWMIFHGRRLGLKVINSTHGITAVHQNHDFGHLPGGRKHRMQPESLENFELAGGRATLFSLRDANRRIIDNRVSQMPLTIKRTLRELSILPLLHLKPLRLGMAVYRLLNPIQARKDKNRHERLKAKVNNPPRWRK